MSLVIHTIVPDGIIVSADTRTTHKENGNVRYDDSAEKIIPFPNYIVVSHCGDSKITDKITVTKFLYKIRKKYGEKATITELPLQILNEYIKNNGKGNTIFMISGYDFMFASTYTINTSNKTIELCRTGLDYGADYRGITKVTHAIMNNDIDFNSLSIIDAIDLTKKCVEFSINISKYCSEQSIGGNCQTYIIDNLHDEIGWLQKNGKIIPDKNVQMTFYKNIENLY